VRQQHRFERRHDRLVDAQRPRQGVAPQPLEQRRTPRQDPRLRPPEKLVAAGADEIGAGSERLLHRSLVTQPMAAQVAQVAAPLVHEHGHAAPAAEARQVRQRHGVGEADDAVIARMHLQEERRLRTDRPLVVGEARLVRRAHLAQDGAALREDVGDAERAADLDQLAARDDHLAPLRQRVEHEHHRGGVVVHHERRRPGEQEPEEPLQVDAARATIPGREVVFERRVGAADFRHPAQRLLGQRRASEVGVDDDASCVDHRNQGRAGAGGRLRLEPGAQPGDGVRERRSLRGGGRPAPPLPQRLEPLAQERRHDGTAETLREGAHLRPLQDFVDRRQAAQTCGPAGFGLASGPGANGVSTGPCG